jgi:putative nucleotidyltransferase with HDIG domain
MKINPCIYNYKWNVKVNALMKNLMALSKHKFELDFEKACAESAVNEEDLIVVWELLKDLKLKSQVAFEHYLHSLRVGILARDIGRELGLEESTLLLSGALHDIGKIYTSNDILSKVGIWTDEDREAIRQHVMDGYQIVRDHFSLIAEIIILHHRFQKDGYPSVLPDNGFDEPTRIKIEEYGRILALADGYDALHRTPSKWSPDRTLNGEEIREKMYEFNPDKGDLIAKLYHNEVFSISRNPGTHSYI